MPNIADGRTFVAGRGKEKAIALLAAAEAVGVDVAEVRTTTDGFHVPNKVAEEYQRVLDENANAGEAEVVEVVEEKSETVEEKPEAAPKKAPAKRTTRKKSA